MLIITQLRTRMDVSRVQNKTPKHQEIEPLVFCSRNLLIPESAAQVGKRSEKAACSMAAKHRHSQSQDAGCLQRRSWLAAASYPEHNFTTNPKYLPATTAPSSYSASLDKRVPCPGLGREAGRRRLWMERGMAMFTSPEDHHCLSASGPVLPHPLEVIHNLQETARPSFSKVDPPAAPEHETVPLAFSIHGICLSCSTA